MFKQVTVKPFDSNEPSMQIWDKNKKPGRKKLEARATLRFARGLRGGLSYPTHFARKGLTLSHEMFQTDRHTDTQTFVLLLYRLLLLLLSIFTSTTKF